MWSPAQTAHTSCENISVNVTLTVQDVYHEYERLRRARVGGSFTTALSAGAEGRNRYSNVLPFDANRVRLRVRPALLERA